MALGIYGLTIGKEVYITKEIKLLNINHTCCTKREYKESKGSAEDSETVIENDVYGAADFLWAGTKVTFNILYVI